MLSPVFVGSLGKQPNSVQPPPVTVWSYSMPIFLMSALKRGSGRRGSKMGSGTYVSPSERSSLAASSQRSACSLSASPRWTSARATAVLPGGRSALTYREFSHGLSAC